MDTFKGFLFGLFCGAVIATVPSYIVGVQLAQKFVYVQHEKTMQQQLIADNHLKNANDMLESTHE